MIKMKKKKGLGKITYLVICALLLMIPSVGLLLGGRENSAESDERAEFPTVTAQGNHLNTDYLQQAGAWFEQNFAWRKELVSANAKLGSLAGVSTQEEVILGEDGWLYYKDSLNDYQGKELLSDRALYDIAHTAKMTQDYCGYIGVSYLFLVVPNKATLYPEYMPYYYAHRITEDSNRKRLAGYMQSEGVEYLDAYDVLAAAAKERSDGSGDGQNDGSVDGQNDKERSDGSGDGQNDRSGDGQTDASVMKVLPYLYHKQDSHWTSEGAAICAGEMLERMRIPYKDYSKAKSEVRKDFEGDLARMLYPACPGKEEEVYYDPSPSYEYLNEVESTFDYFIQTVSPAKSGSLVMYRDSFANALLPFLAEGFSSAFFSRGIPENVTFDLTTYAGSNLVMEHAERNLPDVAQTVPILQSLPSGLHLSEMSETDGSGAQILPVKVHAASEEANPYYCRIEGIVDESMEAGVRILADPGDGTLYEAMPRHLPEGGEGFVLCLSAEEFPPEKMDDQEITVCLLPSQPQAK